MKPAIINWICALTLLIGQWAAVDVQACSMHELDTEFSMDMDMSGHDHHAAMTARESSNDHESCCDDCACAMSSCQSHHKLPMANDLNWHHLKAAFSFYHSSLKFNRTVEWPLRPPIS